MPSIAYWIDRCCRRLNRGVTLKVIAEWLAIWLCVFGTLVLVVKIGVPILWPGILWFAATLPFVLAVAVERSRNERFIATDGAALLDDRLGVGGLLMTVAEKPNGDWQQSLPRETAVWEAALPRVRPKRFVRIITLPVLFVAIAFVVPARAIPTDPKPRTKPPLQAVAELPQMLTELKKAGVLDEEETEYLQPEIDKLVKETAGSPPTADHWRKIDALRARLRARLESQVRTVEKGRNAATQLAEAGKKDRPPLTKEQRDQLEKDLIDALNKLNKGGKTPPAGKQLASVGKTGPSKSSEPKTGQPVGKSVAVKTDIKVATKTGSPIPPDKTSAKTAVSKTGVTPAKTVIAKTDGGKSPITKTFPVNKTAVSGKTEKSSIVQGKTIKTGDIQKSLSLPKTLPLPKSFSFAKKSTSAGKSEAKQQAAKAPDMKQLLEMASKLPPEAQRELMQMALSGKFTMPEHPAAREMLMQQAQKMLENQSGQLGELQKRFAELAGGSLRPEDLRIPPGLENLISQAKNRGIGPGRDPLPGVKSGTPPANRQPREKGPSFRDIVLPPGLLDKPKTDLDHLTGKVPTVNPVRPTQSTGDPMNTTAESPGGESWKRTVRPRHRRLVSEYFRTEEKKSK